MLPTRQTQSSAPEDGRNYRPKHVELIEIVYKIIIVASSWLFILLNPYRFQMRALILPALKIWRQLK